MPSSPLRVLGVSVADVSDWRDAQPAGKWSRFFSALGSRYELVEVVRPALSRPDSYLNLARSFRPRSDRWKARAGFNRSLARRRTEAVQRGLDRHPGGYDLILLHQTLCAPGVNRGGIPYAVYTDNTMALTQRLSPASAPLSRRAAGDWMEFEADVCRSAAAVLTLSEFARRSVIDDYRCAPERVVAVGAGANQWLESPSDRPAAAPRALFAGMDFVRKGGLVLLEAWPMVRARVPEAELVIAGPTGKPRSELPPGIRWVGRVDRARLAELYRSASVFVMPSLFEPYGLVFLEAMGYGLPCVGTSVCAMPEIIDDGVTGRLVPSHEAEPLAGALTELLAEPAKAGAMGRAAHDRVLQRGRWNDVVDRVAAHLARVAAG